MYFYHKNGVIKMRSVGKIEAPDLDWVEILTTPDEDLKLEQNIPCKIVNDTLAFDVPVVQNLPDIKAIVDKAKTIDDLKSVIQLLVK